MLTEKLAMLTLHMKSFDPGPGSRFVRNYDKNLLGCRFELISDRFAFSCA